MYSSIAERPSFGIANRQCEVICDLSRIAARHEAINLRLEHWAFWVRVRPQAWKMQPMWRNYRAPRQYEIVGIKTEVNPLECHEIERAVSMLPDKIRTAIRWSYVYPGIHPNMLQRHIGVTRNELGKMLDDGRDMLKNRLQINS